MQGRTFLAGLLQSRCPRCRNGKLFKYPVSDLKKFSIMNETCPSCGVRLQPEPGFYQGAMYVSYAFTVAIIISLSIVLYYLGDPSDWVYIGSIITVMILLVPLNFRYSRVVYLYLFGGLKYRKAKS